jgi:basic membrane lipoprotein Med (substrate-binding protein (PBP1-ABC) superfamily)/DNA-binding SARP family transcriptional activator
MRYEILGPVRAIDGDEELDLGSRKQRALLGLLLANTNRMVPTERIIDELWPGDPEGHENALWVYISRLRRILEPGRSGRGGHEVLQTRDHGYVLNVPADSVDANRFEDLVRQARHVARDDATAAAELLRAAESEWHGRPLEGVDADFATAEAVRLEELRISALEDRFDLELGQGAAGNLAEEIETVSRGHPYRERLMGQLMLSLYRAGRQAEALRTFERFRRAIGEDLGIAPSPELARLEEQILLHDSRLQPRRSSAPSPYPVVTGRQVVAGNPFKGLRAFGEDDARDFFGRDQLVADVVRRIGSGASLLALVGPSGSGKSSAVRAGVIPALRKGAVDGSDRWLTAQMVPGARPFAELEAALLRSTLDGPDSLAVQLRGEDGLLGAALRLLPDDSSRLLLVIDQFEELYTLVDDDGTRSAFLDALIPAIDDPHGRVSLLLTLRADFYARPLAHPEFGRRMGDGVVNVVPLTTDELEAAAVEPMRRAGCHFEPSVLVALLGDVAGQPGALPVFQYTLTELFERRAGDIITMGSYEQMGGVLGALAQRAEDLFDGLSEADHEVSRQLFLRLVTIGEGDEWGRRRVAAREVLGLDVDVVALQRVIHAFGDHRLLSFDRDQVTGAPTVEVAHEAILTEWPRLEGWIAEARVDVRRRASLGAAAVEWEAADRNPDYLFAGTRLDEYEAWAGTSVLALTELERAFLDEAIAKRDADVRADAERAARERTLGRRALVRAWGLAVAVAVILAVGGWLIFFAGQDARPTVAGVRLRERADPAMGQLTQQLANGWEQAVAELDVDFVTLTPTSDVQSEIEALIATEPDLVYLEAFESDLWSTLGASGSSLSDIVEDHPEQLFAMPDEVVGAPENVAYAGYATEEGSFLAGAAAALTSRTGTIGYIGGFPSGTDGWRAGFEAGARRVDPEIEILATHLTGRVAEVFQIGGDADEATIDLMERGADVILPVVGETQFLVLDVAAAWPDRHVWVIGVDGDMALEAGDAGDHVLTSMLKRHELMVLELLRGAAAGTLEPGPLEGNLANGVIELARSSNLEDEVVVALSQLREAMVAGEIEVPDLPEDVPILAVGTDLVVDLVVGESSCEVEGLAPMNNDVVRFDITNERSEPIHVALWKVFDGTPVESVTASAFEAGELTPESLPASAIIVAARSSSALTVDFEDPGDWMVVCTTEDFEATVNPIRVEEHDPTVTVAVDASDLDSTEPPALAAGNVLGLELTNRSSVPRLLDLFLTKGDQTSLDVDWYLRSGARHYRTVFVPPGGAAQAAVLLDEAGTWALASGLVGDAGPVNVDNLTFEVTPQN